MKKMILKNSFLILGLIFLFSGSVNAQFWVKKGNGDVQKQDREIRSFSAISASNGINVYVLQSDKESLSVETDENLLEYIITRVEDNELIIKVDGNFHRATKIDVFVNLIDVTEINVSSGGNIETRNILKLEKCDISVNSGADAKIEINTGELSCSVSSGADATLKGTADYFEGKASSGSDLHAKELIAKNCKAKASSGGDVSVYASETLEANASSGGDVTYYGNPTKVNARNSSGGDINQR
ncbi:head GIN domain-containing protein [Labilibaculum sp.]|uniref:head GIN domain-containing protein n=1 Tax=Labilibaculum sp. TaxID=2060723 RepID=UPI003567BADE